MKTIKTELVYPGATVAQVAAMLADPAFRRAVAAYQHAIRSDITVTPDGAGRRIVFEYAHGTERIPGFAKKLVGDEIPIVQEETWRSDSDGDILVTIPGKPGEMKVTARIVQRGDDAVETIDLAVKVSIPLLGGKIEDLIAGLLEKGFRAENKVGVKWLAGTWEAP